MTRSHLARAWDEGYARGFLDAVAHLPRVWPRHNPYEAPDGEQGDNSSEHESRAEAASYLVDIDPHGRRLAHSAEWARRQLFGQRATPAEHDSSSEAELHEVLRRAAESETVRRVRKRLAEPGEPWDFDSFVREELGMTVGEDGKVLAEEVPSDAAATFGEPSEHLLIQPATETLDLPAEATSARAAEPADSTESNEPPTRVLALWEFGELVGLYEDSPRGREAAEADAAAPRRQYSDDVPDRDPATWDDRIRVVIKEVSAKRRREHK